MSIKPENREKAGEAAKIFLVRGLVEVLVYAKKNYYNGFQTLNDEAYDAIEEGLKKLCPNHPVLGAVGDVSFEFMLGLEKTRELLFPVEDLDDAL